MYFIPVFCSPPFHKTHSYGAHSSQLIHGFKTLINRLSQKSSKFLVVEDLQITSWWNFTHYCSMSAIFLITVGALLKDCTITQALSKNFPTYVIQAHSSSYLSSCHFYCSILFGTDSKLKQNFSEFDVSVKPSTVSEGCDAWKVSLHPYGLIHNMLLNNKMRLLSK